MSSPVRQLEELAQNWTATELCGDTTFLGSALTDDFVGIGPRSFLLTKEQWLARFGSGGLRYESFGMDEVVARIYGGAATDTGVTARAADVWTVYDPSEENLMSFPRVEESLLSGSTFWWMFLHPISQYHRRYPHERKTECLEESC